MERLTYRTHDGGIFVKESDVKTFEVGDEVMHTGNAIRKLAEYEDLEDKLKEQFNGCVDLKMIVDSIIEYDKQLGRGEKLAKAMLITNDSVRKFCEWESLEKQGKLLKLPCKVGDKIYVILRNHQIRKKIVIKFKMIADGWAVETGDWFYLFDEFGKTVFLTPEEAEAALQRLEAVE